MRKAMRSKPRRCVMPVLPGGACRVTGRGSGYGTQRDSCDDAGRVGSAGD